MHPPRIQNLQVGLVDITQDTRRVLVEQKDASSDVEVVATSIEG